MRAWLRDLHPSCCKFSRPENRVRTRSKMIVGRFLTPPPIRDAIPIVRPHKQRHPMEIKCSHTGSWLLVPRGQVNYLIQSDLLHGFEGKRSNSELAQILYLFGFDPKFWTLTISSPESFFVLLHYFFFLFLFLLTQIHLQALGTQ